MGLLIYSLQETDFQVIQTDLLTSRDAHYFFGHSFSIGRNIFQIVKELILSLGKTVMFPLAETYLLHLETGYPVAKYIFLLVKALFALAETSFQLVEAD